MQREDKKTFHRDCEIKYSVHENDGKYHSDAYVYVHAEDTLVSPQLCSKEYSTFNEAEKNIIKQAEEWIDQKIDLERRFQHIRNTSKNKNES